MTTYYQANVFVGIEVQKHPKVIRYLMTREQYNNLRYLHHDDIDLFIGGEFEGHWDNFLVDACDRLKPEHELYWMAHPDQNIMRDKKYRTLLGQKIVEEEMHTFHDTIETGTFVSRIMDAYSYVNGFLNPMNYPENTPKVFVFTNCW